LSNLVSAKGQTQIVEAIQQLIQKNIDSSELIVANSDIKLKKTGWAQNFTDDPLMNGKRIDKMILDGKTDKPVYDNKDLEVPGVGDVRDVEQKAFEETAAEGPSGAIGKSLPDKDKTLNHEELALKEEMKRAYLSFLSKKAQK
jgi:hypothetical protein